MENFIVSARKYRPNMFDSVIGQENITITLKNSIKTKQLAHAYLFCGPRGVGKTTCARIFAKTINCLNPTEKIEPCNECNSCTAFNRSGSFNIHELDAASNNSVDDIRSLNEKVRIPPQISKYSVYIIDEVHMLSTSAFNAFLKTLEEPPAHAIFILATTEKHKILPTILSRCQVYDFNRISVEDIIKQLTYVAGKENINISAEALNVIAQKADGALRDALSIFDQIVSFTGKEVSYENVLKNLNVLDYEYFFKVTESIVKGDVNTILFQLEDIVNNGFDPQYFISGLLKHFRDLLVCKADQTAKLIDAVDSVRARYINQSKALSPLFIYKAMDIANECESNYKQSSSKRFLVELALLKMTEINNSTLGFNIEPQQTNATNTVVTSQTNAPVISEAASQNENLAKEPLVNEYKPEPAKKHEVPTNTNVIKAGSTISIKNALSGQKSQENNDTNSPIENIPRVNEPRKITIDDEDKISKAWIDYAENIKSMLPSLSVTMNTCLPKVVNNELLVKINNELQESEIKKHFDAIKSHIVKNTESLKLSISFEYNQIDEGQKKLYTDTDKIEHLTNNNEDFAFFRKSFGLEVE